MSEQLTQKVLLQATNPKTGKDLEGKFEPNSLQDLSVVAENANTAFAQFRHTSNEQRARLLESIGEEIMALGDALINWASTETGLPVSRITGERGRTFNQLKLFASLLREGSWKEASIDTALPDRQPVPKPDIRKVLVPIGPVAVFTASNFPLAFSTAGGDTASALAAGNPVIVKGHNAHLGTHQMVAEAIGRAVKSNGLPSGVFSSLIGADFTLGQALVQHPGIKAVGFTGSFSGGKALYDLAVARAIPIPVYAEMSSVNPTILMPEATALHAAKLAQQLAGSVTLGVGQFCTNPGLIIGIESPELEEFCAFLQQEIAQLSGGTMLHQGIYEQYHNGVQAAIAQPEVETLGSGREAKTGLPGDPLIATCKATTFLGNEQLKEEVFGPYSLVVKCKDAGQMVEVLHKAGGQLTITFMATDSEMKNNQELLAVATTHAGRVIFNGVPTGVEVCHSMVHGGPFPATTDARTTSVGTDAIKRFTRPVCYQDAPQDLLPDELKDHNPLNVFRTVNGMITKDKITTD